MVPALAAAIVGRFQYLIPTVVAGLGIGMIQAWLIYLSGKHSWMPSSGVGEIVPLVVILVALLVTGRAMPGARRRAPIPSRAGPAPAVVHGADRRPVRSSARSRCSVTHGQAQRAR